MKTRQSNKKFLSTPKPQIRSFTLIELIIVIIIIGILASLGLSQYNLMIEKSRLAEAKIRIGVMRDLAYQYYLENGTLIGMTDADAGADNTCSGTNFYAYWITPWQPTAVSLIADRCTSGGKAPNASRRYYFFLNFHPNTGLGSYYCRYTDDSSACFGLAPNGP